LRHFTVLLAVMVVCLSGCKGLELSPLTSERRNVHLEQDKSKTVTVKIDMAWYDGSPPVHGLVFPAGVYALEAEDDEYWYMRSSVPLEFKDYRKGGGVQSRRLAGGLMIGKIVTRAVPAAGYIDAEGSSKVLVWKLGSAFLGLEGKDWKKSF
jgi:hypothetical protein